MNVVFSIQHPAHVHVFKHAIRELRDDPDHRVDVFVRGKEFTSDLLAEYGIDHAVLTGEPSSFPDLLATQVSYEYRLWRQARRLDPDVIAAVGGLSAAHVATLVGCRSVAFTDTEHARLQNALAFPFVDQICTPDCYLRDHGEKQYRYPGYHELAYLHPDRFDPDPSVFDDLHVAPDDTLAVVRLVSWRAAHDVGAGGFADVRDAVERLEDAGAKVIVTSEAPLPEGLERCRAPIPAHRMHDLLYYADLFVGESGTMAAESAVLGTPAVFVSTIDDAGILAELRDEYGLLFTFDGERRHERAIRTARDVADADPDVWTQRRDRLLADKIDATDVILERVLAADADAGGDAGAGEDADDEEDFDGAADGDDAADGNNAGYGSADGVDDAERSPGGATGPTAPRR